MTTPTTELLMALHDAAVAAAIQVALANLGDRDNATRDVLLAALQARDQQGPIKTWRERIEETCPALGPMHIHASVEEVNDAMMAEIDDLRAALQEQAREGEAVAKVVLTKTLGLPTMQWLGLDKQFDLADGQLLYTTPQAAQPESIECDCGRIHKKTRYGWACSEPAQPLPLTYKQINDVCVDVHLKRDYNTNLEKFIAIARAIEAAHGIGGAL